MGQSPFPSVLSVLICMIILESVYIPVLPEQYLQSLDIDCLPYKIIIFIDHLKWNDFWISKIAKMLL